MSQNANKTRQGIPIQNKAKASQPSYLRQQWGKKSNSKELDKQSKKQENTLVKKNDEKKTPRKKTAIVITAPIFHIFAAYKNYQIMHNHE